ncbi:MAG: hypothetical protein EBV72_01480 [Betaproteobacteria bacterium]|nr:hypothetical protein [Betaproteobacteria bacterium]
MRTRQAGLKPQALTFSESEGVRYLHFGTPWIQGAMRIKHPHRLVLEYTQDMMAWLMLLAAPSYQADGCRVASGGDFGKRYYVWHKI